MDDKEKNKQEHMMAIRTEITTNKGSAKKRGKNTKPSVSIRYKTISNSKERAKGRKAKKGKVRRKDIGGQATPEEIVVIRSFLSFLMAFLPALISHPKILKKLTKMVKEEVKEKEG